MAIATVAVSLSNLSWWDRELLSGRLMLLLPINIATELLTDFSFRKSPHLSDTDTPMLREQAPHFLGDPSLLALNQSVSSIPWGNCLCPSSSTAPLHKLTQSLSFPTTASPPSGLFAGGTPAESSSSPPQASSLPPAGFHTSASTQAIQRNKQPKTLMKLLPP